MSACDLERVDLQLKLIRVTSPVHLLYNYISFERRASRNLSNLVERGYLANFQTFPFKKSAFLEIIPSSSRGMLKLKSFSEASRGKFARTFDCFSEVSNFQHDRTPLFRSPHILDRKIG